MSRFEYSAVSLTWPLLTECAVHLFDSTMYQTKIRSKGTWGLVSGRAVSEFVSSACFSSYHCLVQTQLSAVMAYPATVILLPSHSSATCTMLCTRWCVRVVYWMTAAALRKSRYRCGRLPGKGKIRNFRLDLSHSGTCVDKTIIIMVAGLRGLGANVASDSKWVLDIHLIGPVQSR
jgi:hypothetical protein